MPGGHARSAPPRDHARDPERWPEAAIADAAARAVQHIARVLGAEIARRKLSLRAVEAATGVSRMAVGPLIEGKSWPDVLTVVRLEQGLGCPLWPGIEEFGSIHEEPLAPASAKRA